MYETTYHAGHLEDAGRLDLKRRQAEDRAAWLLRRTATVGTAFEIGCGEGSLLAQLASAGVDVAGVEPSKDSAAYGRRTFGVDIVTGEFPAVSRRADAVIAMHVIEHIPSTAWFLKAVRDAIAPGGSFFVETPNLLRPKPGRISANLLAAPHLIVFTPASLERALAAVGLAVIHFESDVNLRALAVVGPTRPPPRATPLTAYKIWRHRRAG